MTTPSNPWGDERKYLSHRLQMREQTLSRRQARRLSCEFERIGVTVPARRLQNILSGAPAAFGELIDVNFALIATQIKHDERVAKFKQLQRRGTRSLIFAGLVLVVLNFLFCLAYAFLNLTQQAPPL